MASKYSHHHTFTDKGQNIDYCSKTINGKICPIAKDVKTGRIGVFVVVNGQGVIPDDCIFNNNQNEGFRSSACGNNIVLNNCSTSTNWSNGIYLFGGELILNNCTINESAEIGNYGACNGRVYLHNHENTAGLYYIYTDYGLIRPQTSVRYSSTGYAWSLAPTSDYRKENYPLDFSIATVAVSANAQVTIKAWMKRTNTGLIFRLRVKGGQIAGVTNDVISYMTAAANTWEQVTLNFTPTEAGVVEILAECWGGSTYTGYIDDLTIIQV